MKRVLPYIFAVLMLLGTAGHIFNPGGYSAMIPPFISENFANILAAIIEGLVGIALLVPKYKKWGGLGFMLLMLAFLPLHVWDLFRPDPVMGSKLAAAFRLIVQFLFIYGGYFIWKKYSEETT